MTAKLVEVTITVPDLGAAIVAWRTGIGLEAVVQESSRTARIDVQGITVVLIEAPAEASTGLAGVALGIEGLEALQASLSDISTSRGGRIVLDPAATSGAPITLRAID